MDGSSYSVDRRKVVTGIGVGVVAAALTTYRAKSAMASPTPQTDSAGPRGGPAPVECAATAQVVAKTTDIPVGTGAVLGDVVVTQPSAGDFRAFCATCTHLGCRLASVSDGLIRCPCHGSRFHLDGSVARGPASQPLLPRQVHASGDSLILEPVVQGLDIPCPSLPNLFP